MGLFLRTVAVSAFVVLWTVLCSLLYLIPALIRPTPQWLDWIHRVFSGGIVWATGIRVQVEGREHLDPSRSVIMMANHRSLLDIPVLFQNLPHLRFVAKRELGFIPVFGWALARSEHILIHRTKRRAAIRTLHATAAFFREQKEGRNIVLFPEGTRSRTRELLPFKKGGFHLAYDLGFPIQPISIRGMDRVFPKGAKVLRPGPVRIIIHPRITVDGLQRDQVLALRDTVREVMKAGLNA